MIKYVQIKHRTSVRCDIFGVKFYDEFLDEIFVRKTHEVENLIGSFNIFLTLPELFNKCFRYHIYFGKEISLLPSRLCNLREEQNYKRKGDIKILGKS